MLDGLRFFWLHVCAPVAHCWIFFFPTVEFVLNTFSFDSVLWWSCRVEFPLVDFSVQMLGNLGGGVANGSVCQKTNQIRDMTTRAL